jgi:hypothetical protein
MSDEYDDKRETERATASEAAMEAERAIELEPAVEPRLLVEIVHDPDVRA